MSAHQDGDRPAPEATAASQPSFNAYGGSPAPAVPQQSPLALEALAYFQNTTAQWLELQKSPAFGQSAVPGHAGASAVGVHAGRDGPVGRAGPIAACRRCQRHASSGAAHADARGPMTCRADRAADGNRPLLASLPPRGGCGHRPCR